VVVPGAGHGMGGAYGQRRMHDFFVRHLLGDAGPQRAAVGVTEPLAPPAISDERPDPARPATRATAPAAQAARTLEAAPRTDFGAGSRVAAASDIPPVTAPPDTFFDMVAQRDRDAARKFYQKYIDVRGMPVVAAGEVADEALQRTHAIVTGMLAGRPDIVGAMVTNRMYLIIIGKDQIAGLVALARMVLRPAALFTRNESAVEELSRLVRRCRQRRQQHPQDFRLQWRIVRP
jgi:hypothetical protein